MMGTSLQPERRAPRLPKVGPIDERTVLTRSRVFSAFQNFPRDQAYLLRLGKSPGYTRKLRRGEKPLTITKLVQWLEVCDRTGHQYVGREALQPMAEVIGHEVAPDCTRSAKSAPEEIADVSRVSGEAIAKAVEALADGEIDVAEASVVLPLLEAVRAETSEAIAALRKIVNEAREAELNAKRQ